MLKQLPKIKWIAVGTCPECRKELIRDGEADTAVCTCKSVVVVKLTIAAILPAKLEKWFEQLAKQYSCTVDNMFNTMMEVGLQNMTAERLKQLLEVTKVAEV